MKTFARVVIPGVPDNWSNKRQHHMAAHREKALWKDLAWKFGHSARNDARWPLPVKCDPPAPRWLVVTVYKRTPLYDQDGCVSALKPIIDGLKGSLLVDDGPEWCCWAYMPTQVVVGEPREEQVVIEVHLADPRPAEATQ